MFNAKTELRYCIVINNILSPIKCGRIVLNTREEINISVGYNEKELEIFYNRLSVVNSTHNEHQEFILTGIIWFKDDTWLTIDMDGTHIYWKYHKLPEIPKEIQ